MFAEQPSWDTDKKYTMDKLSIYYENRRTGKLVKLKMKTTLLKALQQPGYLYILIFNKYLRD